MNHVLPLFVILGLLLAAAPSSGAGFSDLEQALSGTRIDADAPEAATPATLNWQNVMQQLTKFFGGVASSVPGVSGGGSPGGATVGGGGSVPPGSSGYTGPVTNGGEAADESAGTPDWSGQGTVDVRTRLNIRDDKWGNIIGKLRKGDKVEIIGKDGDWYKIRVGDRDAFVHSRYVNKDGSVKDGGSRKGYINTQESGLNVRSSPWGPIIGQVDKGSPIKIIGRDGDFTIIEHDGKRGYVHNDHVALGDPPSGTGTDTGTGDTGTQAGDTPADVKPGANGFTFPVGIPGCRFTDTWGAPRSGGRRHEGTDIFNRRNSPLVACKTGTIGRINYNLGGRSIRVLADGVSHYYTHLERYANVRTGQPIQAGQVIGYMGNSGNAASTPVHLHFGMYRNNRAFNPYPTLHASYRWGAH